MSIEYKILAQRLLETQYTLTPGTGGYGYYDGVVSTNVAEDLEPVTVYTVPAGKTAMVTSCFVTNHVGVQTTYDLAIVPSGETLALKHHIRWDFEVEANGFDLIDSKLTLGSGDSVVIYPSNLDELGVTVFGVEFS